MWTNETEKKKMEKHAHAQALKYIRSKSSIPIKTHLDCNKAHMQIHIYFLLQ